MLYPFSEYCAVIKIEWQILFDNVFPGHIVKWKNIEWNIEENEVFFFFREYLLFTFLLLTILS